MRIVPHMGTRRALVVALLPVTLSAVACGSEEEPTTGEVTTVKVATIPPFTVTTWPVIVADAQGFFQEESIEIELTFTFDGGQLLAGDQVDILNDGGDSGVIAAAQGKDIVEVAPVALTVTDGIVVLPDIATVSDLVGKKLRVTGFGTDEFLARRFVEEQGVSPDDVEWVAIDDDGAALAQLEAGKIDGGMFDQGFIYDVEKSGEFRVLAKPTDLGVFPWNVIQTTRSYAEANHDVVVGFIRAVQKAMRFIQDAANRDAVIDAVAAAGEDRAEVDSTYEAAQGFTLYTFDPLTAADLEPALESLVFLGEEVGDFDVASLIDNSYFEEATG